MTLTYVAYLCRCSALLLVCCQLPCCWSDCPRQVQTLPSRLLPNSPGFPAASEFVTLAQSLNGSLLRQGDALYTNASLMYNRRVAASPYAIVYVQSAEDVQKVVTFTKRYNLWLTVRSSGHSYIGRSTHTGSVMIDLSRMKGKQFNLNSTRGPAGEVKLQSGNTWLEVYKAVDSESIPKRRIIVGGSAHTVAMGGYTQGGGHSPICRSLGMAVDNLLEATIILSNGTRAVVNAQGTTLTDASGQTTTTSDSSLFWAIRGGGGGTWGVVVDFTFKLHWAPDRFRNIVIAWALRWREIDIGSDTIRYVLQQLSLLSSEWGGYMILSGGVLNSETKGSLTLFLNHFGSNSSASNAEVNGLLAYNVSQNQYIHVDRVYNTFLEYELEAKDPEYIYGYIWDNFLQSSDIADAGKLSKLAAVLMDLQNVPDVTTSVATCTGILVGGAMNNQSSGATAVHPKFRSAALALSCGLAWTPTGDDSSYMNKALQWRANLAAIGDGVYFNEPAEDLPGWKLQFWGSNATYGRLLDTKKLWDPDNYFWCHNCVGSDLNAAYQPASASMVDYSGQCTSSSSSFYGYGLLLANCWALVAACAAIVWTVPQKAF